MEALKAMFYRQLKRFWRSKGRVAMLVLMPLLWMVFFGIGWASSLNVPIMEQILGTDYLTFMLPGVIAMAVFMTAFMSGVSVIWDKQFGFLKEVLVAPAPRWQSLLGRILGDSVIATIQGIILFLLGLPLAKNVMLSGLPLTVLVAFISALGFAALGSLIASMKVRSFEAFQAIANMLMMPMIFASGAFFPLMNLPDWFWYITDIDPMTYAVDAMRQALAGVGYYPLWLDMLALTLFALAFIVLAVKVFERTTVE